MEKKGYYTGLSVEKAVENVNTKLAEAVIGENALDQTYIDSLLIQTDGTDNKSNLGANATLGVSMAVARAAAMALRIPLYQYIGGLSCKQNAGSYDEYFEWGASCRQHGGFSGSL